jgi:hypothetical protein
MCLHDVIGAFHEMGYTQLVHGGRKLQVNFKLKDLRYISFQIIGLHIFNCLTSSCVSIKWKLH